MDLRPRKSPSLSGFSEDEVRRMDSILQDSKANVLDQDFCRKLAKAFNRSKGQTRQPVLKWMEIQNWFKNRQKSCLEKDAPADATKVLPDVPESHHPDKEKETSNVQKVLSSAEKAPDLSELEFEARSSKDGAWYDIDSFISHRYLSSGDAEVLVRFNGFGEEEDEWVNIRKSVRERSIGLEHSECNKVMVGDSVLCFQEKKDLARYFEAHVTEIQRRLHDIRGCRCLFVIQYDHDNTQETVRLKRLCFRPSILVRLPES